MVRQSRSRVCGKQSPFWPVSGWQAQERLCDGSVSPPLHLPLTLYPLSVTDSGNSFFLLQQHSLKEVRELCLHFLFSYSLFLKPFQSGFLFHNIRKLFLSRSSMATTLPNPVVISLHDLYSTFDTDNPLPSFCNSSSFIFRYIILFL